MCLVKSLTVVSLAICLVQPTVAQSQTPPKAQDAAMSLPPPFPPSSSSVSQPPSPLPDFAGSDKEAATRIEAGKLLLEAVQLNGVVNRLVQAQMFSQAEPLARKVVELHRQASGEDDVDLALSRRTLAEIYVAMNRLREAESLHKRSLATLEDQLGKEDLEVCLSLNLLARVYMSMGLSGSGASDVAESANP